MRETGKAVRQASRPRRAASTWSGCSRPPCLAGTSPSPPRLGGPGDCLERVRWDPRPRVAGRPRRCLGSRGRASRAGRSPAPPRSGRGFLGHVVLGGSSRRQRPRPHVAPSVGPPACSRRAARHLLPVRPPGVRDLGTEELHLCRPKHPALRSEGPWWRRAACVGGPSSSGLFLVVFLKRPQNRMPHKPHRLPFQRGR